MTARQGFADFLETAFATIPELADVWVQSSQDDVPVDSRVTVVVSQTSIGPFPAAPHSHRSVGLSLAVVSPNPDTNTAADELEPIVDAILDYLDGITVTVGTAQVTTYTGPEREQFAYRIPVSVPAKKKD